ncbi:MAG: hypothetical protein HKL85_09705 [Acidimicrobiaceae bacterium]|nr:hypothetical protein [Acidimicrobiaceae bacterium]
MTAINSNSSEIGAETKGGHLGRRYLSIVVTLLLALVGTIGATFGANAVAHNSAEKARQAFTTSSSQIASTLQLAIQHENDLVVSAGAFVTGNPSTSQAQFVQWVTSVQALKRYP